MAKRVKSVTIVITSDYSGLSDAHTRSVVQYIVDDSGAPDLEKKSSLEELDVEIQTTQLEDELRVFLSGVKSQCEDAEGL